MDQNAYVVKGRRWPSTKTAADLLPAPIIMSFNWTLIEALYVYY